MAVSKYQSMKDEIFDLRDELCTAKAERDVALNMQADAQIRLAEVEAQLALCMQGHTAALNANEALRAENETLRREQLAYSWFAK